MEQIRVLKQPVISEKSFASADNGKYVFMVAKEATKIEIAQSVEKAFKVHVLSVNTVIVKGKVKRFGKTFGRRKDYKKAVVMIKKDEKIEDFKGI
ncbi:MAG: 50S ribosomal protein L23 [Patescibacteria group bacterium]|jgi:large subunit ribosomal protein L23|nr:50S ribosomal protein L23 [Patescibacteria group bacterium]